MSKKVGIKGAIIRSQGRELVNNVIKFMKKEADVGLTIPLEYHRARSIAATGISKTTYQKITKEARIVEWSGPSASFQSPTKKGPKQATKLGNITIEQIKNIRELIYNIYILEKRRPTSKYILQKIKDMKMLTEDISLTSLTTFLKQIGFRWQRTQDNKLAVMETYNIRLKRINYLTKMLQYRSEGRKIIYTNKTYIHNSHTKELGLHDQTSKNLKKSISKAQRLMVVHAGGEDGFIPNGLLIVHSDTKSGDCHDDMNHENFMKWINEQLLPNLPQNSVLVVDNAPYHNVTTEKPVTPGSFKSEIINWLTEKNLPADPKCTKPELYKIVKENKFRFPVKYKLDELLEQHGHCVLRLPPYHLELNPIEKIWTIVQNWVTSRNTTFTLKDVETLTRQKLTEITSQEWMKICQQIKSYENNAMEKEHLFDEVQKTLQFTVNTDSSEETESEESEDDLDFEC